MLSEAYIRKKGPYAWVGIWLDPLVKEGKTCSLGVITFVVVRIVAIIIVVKNSFCVLEHTEGMVIPGSES